VNAAGRLAQPTIVRASEVDRGLLRAAGLELERVVMLDPTDTGLTVCRLTPEEKVDHTERTGESAFLGSEEEQERSSPRWRRALGRCERGRRPSRCPRVRFVNTRAWHRRSSVNSTRLAERL
jgi:hypothetical protein